MRDRRPTRRHVAGAVLVLAALAACGTTTPATRSVTDDESVLATPSSDTALPTAEPTAAGATALPTAASPLPAGTTGGSLPSHAPQALPSPTVVRKPLQIGFFLPDTAKLATAMGMKADAFGDPKGAVQTLVAAINAKGGLGGHKILPVMSYIDDTSGQTYDVQEQAACSSFFQDNKVFAVVDPLSPSVGPLKQCTREKRTALLSGTPVYAGEPNIVWPANLGLQRMPGVYVDRLAAQSFFTKGAKVGLVESDIPTIKAIAVPGLKQALKAHGVTLFDEATVHYPGSSTELGKYISDSGQAALRFAQAGVDHVMFLLGQTPQFFMSAAANQQYKPRYGLSSMDTPFNITKTAPASQLHNAVGVGWQPASDTVAPYTTNALTPTGHLCLNTMAKAGQDTTNPSNVAVDLLVCEGVWMLRDAMAKQPDVSSTGLVNALLALGDTLEPVSTFRTMFRTGRLDGVAGARDMYFDDACPCFRYRGATYFTR